MPHGRNCIESCITKKIFQKKNNNDCDAQKDERLNSSMLRYDQAESEIKIIQNAGSGKMNSGICSYRLNLFEQQLKNGNNHHNAEH